MVGVNKDIAPTAVLPYTRRRQSTGTRVGAANRDQAAQVRASPDTVWLGPVTAVSRPATWKWTVQAEDTSGQHQQRWSWLARQTHCGSVADS